MLGTPLAVEHQLSNSCLLGLGLLIPPMPALYILYQASDLIGHSSLRPIEPHIPSRVSASKSHQLHLHQPSSHQSNLLWPYHITQNPSINLILSGLQN
jgi:hypothetical protein